MSRPTRLGALAAVPFVVYAYSTDNHGTGAWLRIYEVFGADGHAVAFLVLFIAFANLLNAVLNYLD
jgi:hypothetical protein